MIKEYKDHSDYIFCRSILNCADRISGDTAMIEAGTIRYFIQKKLIPISDISKIKDTLYLELKKVLLIVKTSANKNSVELRATVIRDLIHNIENGNL